MSGSIWFDFSIGIEDSDQQREGSKNISSSGHKSDKKL